MLTAMRFAAWAQMQHSFPMPEQIMGRFHCSRATAQRWCLMWGECIGVDRPRRDNKGRVRA